MDDIALFAPDVRQIILLAVAIAVPAVFFALRRPRLVLGWVCITLFVQVFDTSIVTNLPAGRVVGLLYLPIAALTVKSWSRLPPARAWLLNLAYLTLLGLVFGFIFPWPDITGSRPFSLSAPGRTLIYLGRLLSDISLTIFVSRQLRKPGAFSYLARALVIGSTLTATAAVFQFIAGIDPYFSITGLGQYVLTNTDRPRGFSYEPRGLGMACAYGILVLLYQRRRLFRSWLPLAAINSVGVLAALSTSAFILLLANVLVALIVFPARWKSTFAFFATIGVILTMIVVTRPADTAAAVSLIKYRIDPLERTMGAAPENLAQSIGYRLDVFDASAFLFLASNSQYMLIGTGPGLVSLPASEYVPPGTYSQIWPPTTGINSLPTHGPLLEVANGGLIGLALWVYQVAFCWLALRRALQTCSSPIDRADWQVARNCFLIGVISYIIQMSISPVWSVVVAMGWAASDHLSRTRASIPSLRLGGQDAIHQSAN